ncbi:MAG: polymerase [Clostridia bacterium]|jgi:DNA polymerase III epsilon subunit-like protein|nr:polymerase [Clostridia bacterium]
MYFIIFDLEFNQDFSSLQNFEKKRPQYPFEIIQIGAIKLDSEFNTIATFNRYVKPTLYTKISPFITELTGITTDQLLIEELFPEVYKAYIEFIGGTDSVFCVWGLSDIKELFRNTEYLHLDNKLLPRMYINIQPYVSTHLNLPAKKLLRLQHAVETLSIPITYSFHNALYDAYYTGEIFKKIYTSSITPKIYDPSYIPIRQQARPRKREIDFDKLLQQFEKMYVRKMTEEEQEIIKLAYKMGKTNQFLK